MDPINDYWHTNRALAAKHGLVWNLPVSDVGQVSKSDAWDLTALAGAVPPPRIQLRNSGFDTKALQYINTQRRELHEPLVEQRALSASWQDVIKAAAIHAIVINRNTPAHVAQNIARPLRSIATCNRQTEPWTLQFDHIQEALDVAAALQPSGLLKGTTEAVVRYVIDYNHLSDSSPLLPAKGAHERRSSGGPATLKRPLTTNGLRKRLVDRRDPEKLPNDNAFWELTRIVFTESPRTFMDALRFAQAQTLIMTGQRIGEVCMIPNTWRHIQEYTALDGRPAGDHGGISRSLALHYFGEKQQAADIEGQLLYPQMRYIPDLFEEPLTNTLNYVAKITAPLRRTLAAQSVTGRLLPGFELEQDVSPAELSPYLSGNPFVYEDPRS